MNNIIKSFQNKNINIFCFEFPTTMSVYNNNTHKNINICNSINKKNLTLLIQKKERISD